MTEEDIPLEVRPRIGTSAPVPADMGEAAGPTIAPGEELVFGPGVNSPLPGELPHRDEPSSSAQAQVISHALGVAERTSPENCLSGPASEGIGELPAPSRMASAHPVPEGKGPGQRDEDLPLLLSPTAEPRPIADAPSAGQPAATCSSGGRLAPPLFWAVVFVATSILVTLYLARTITGWATNLAAVHPALAFTLYGSVGVLLGAVLWTVCRQLQAYWRLTVLGDFRGRLEQARDGQVGKQADEQLRREFLAHVERLRTTGVVSDDVCRSVLAALREPAAPGAWVERASACLLCGVDEQVKQEIECEARRVGVVTALSPSGPLDTAVVLWRGARLVLRIAQIYGLRPGSYGSYRLFRRVTVHMVVAGLSEEALHLLYAAYGPAAAEAAAKGFRSLFDLVSKGGMLLAPVEPLTGGLLAVGGAVGKGASDAAGAAVTLVTGPLLQGVLNAIFTLRIGLAAQHECRLLALTPQERRTQSAGIVSALLGFFRSVRRPALSPQVGAGGPAGRADSQAGE